MRIEGNEHIPAATLTPLLNTTPGQLLSPRNLAGDHDALLTEYYSQGFDQADVNVTQQTEPSDTSKVDVVFHIDRGSADLRPQRAIDRASNSRVRKRWRAPSPCIPAIRSTRSALADTQRNLYAFALFNEVEHGH